jgi:hypothetical protein
MARFMSVDPRSGLQILIGPLLYPAIMLEKI